jgi:predicted RNA-binding Zn ribbon-like protein
VRAFINTVDVDRGDETLTGPAALEHWLREHGLAIERPLDDEDHRRTLAFREALRGLLLANNQRPLEPSTLEALRAGAGQGLLRIEIDADGQAALAPAGGGVDDLVARLLAAVAEAQAEGVWERLKACPADDCGWAFFDQSRNRSRIWCSMESCGNRAKTRSYRARQAE